ncbi:MAG: hypothetical protein BWY91_01740 [bacterium ADurb.BinA028]|nr:MAG: hypothetical protein BWY91_01740 [bacterium ADurb.BinA028]
MPSPSCARPRPASPCCPSPTRCASSSTAASSPLRWANSTTLATTWVGPPTWPRALGLRRWSSWRGTTGATSNTCAATSPRPCPSWSRPTRWTWPSAAASPCSIRPECFWRPGCSMRPPTRCAGPATWPAPRAAARTSARSSSTSLARCCCSATRTARPSWPVRPAAGSTTARLRRGAARPNSSSWRPGPPPAITPSAPPASPPPSPKPRPGTGRFTYAAVPGSSRPTHGWISARSSRRGRHTPWLGRCSPRRRFRRDCTCVSSPRGWRLLIPAARRGGRPGT